MAKPISRTFINIIDPDMGDNQAVLRAGSVAIDLRMVQASINRRKNDELSWSHLMKAMDDSTTVHSVHTGSGALQRVLRKQLVEHIGRPLTPSEQAKLNDNKYPSPVQGFAATISEFFNLAHVAPQFDAVLRETEQNSLEKGVKMGSADNGADKDGLSHEASILQARAVDAAAVSSPAHTVIAGNTHTYVGNATVAHQEAHAAAREIRPGSEHWQDRGQYDSVTALAAEARANREWRARATMELKTPHDSSLDR